MNQNAINEARLNNQIKAFALIREAISKTISVDSEEKTISGISVLEVKLGSRLFHFFEESRYHPSGEKSAPQDFILGQQFVGIVAYTLTPAAAKQKALDQNAVFDESDWVCDKAVLNQGKLQIQVLGDLGSAVRELVSTACAEDPIAPLVWKVCPHDKLKLELFHGTRHVQSIWRYSASDRHWATLMGHSSETKTGAMKKALEAARAMLRNAFSERISSMGDHAI